MTTTTNDLPDLAAKAVASAERFAATAEQGQQLGLDSAKTWAKAISTLPVLELPTATDAQAVPSALGALASYPFEVATHLLKAQRDVTKHIVSAMTIPTSN